MEFPDWVQVKEKTQKMANKSVPRNRLSDETPMDNDSRITETIVYLYTYSSDTHIFIKPGLLQLNCNTMVKLRYRNGQHYSGILKISAEL